MDGLYGWALWMTTYGSRLYVGSALAGCGKSTFLTAVSPQRLKPAENSAVIAAVNRCATQNQVRHRVFPASC
jgi:hypothetical protein